MTAAAVPVVGLSLLCKTVTGHGLPGDVLGAIEGVSWLVVPLGAGSLALASPTSARRATSARL